MTLLSLSVVVPVVSDVSVNRIETTLVLIVCISKIVVVSLYVSLDHIVDICCNDVCFTAVVNLSKVFRGSSKHMSAAIVPVHSVTLTFVLLFCLCSVISYRLFLFYSLQCFHSFCLNQESLSCCVYYCIKWRLFSNSALKVFFLFTVSVTFFRGRCIIAVYETREGMPLTLATFVLTLPFLATLLLFRHFYCLSL